METLRKVAPLLHVALFLRHWINTEQSIHHDASVTGIQGWNRPCPTPTPPPRAPILTSTPLAIPAISAVMHALTWYHFAAGQMINLKAPH